jgi:hypothetical protein
MVIDEKDLPPTTVENLFELLEMDGTSSYESFVIKMN